MDLLDILAPICLILMIRASLAYPLNTSSQSPILAQVGPKYVGDGYPVYPTICPLPSPSSRAKPEDLPNILSDCSWIINEDLLHRYSLLFQDLVFTHKDFTDQYGRRFLSRWEHGQCVISVTSGVRTETDILQLFNVVLAANKVLSECILDQQIPQGGIVRIGSFDKAFHVIVLGSHAHDAVNESNLSLLLGLNSFGQDIQHNVSHTMLNTEPSTGDLDANQSTVSARDATQGLEPEGARSTSNLILHLAHVSRSGQAPPDHPVNCLNPYSVRSRHAGVEDCNFVINEIILRYSNSISPQTFGYGPSADIDLSSPETGMWIHGSCVIYVANTIKTGTETFRMVDVAIAAQRILRKCVIGAKYPVGGNADVGRIADNFHVVVGGYIAPDATNPSIPRNLSSPDLVGDRIGTHDRL